MSARTAVLAALTGCALAAGCSTGSIHLASTQDVLRSDVLALTQASATHNWSAAGAAMDELRGDLAGAIASGRISAARADAIRSHLTAVAADIAAQRAATSTSTAKPQPKPKPKPQPTAPTHDKHGHGGHEGGDDNGD